MKLAALILGSLMLLGLLGFLGSLLWAFFEERRFDRMNMDDKLRQFLKKSGGKL